MKHLGYPDYQSYRTETNRHVPRTECGHKEELWERLSILYGEKDYRTLELIMDIAGSMSGCEDRERKEDIMFTISRLLKANARSVGLCKAVLR